MPYRVLFYGRNPDGTTRRFECGLSPLDSLEMARAEMKWHKSTDATLPRPRIVKVGKRDAQ